MADEQDSSEPLTPPPLGPGDDDPKSPPRFSGAPTARGPLGPGESASPNPDDAFEFLAAPPAGPGETAVTRHVVRIPKRVTPEPADKE